VVDFVSLALEFVMFAQEFVTIILTAINQPFNKVNDFYHEEYHLRYKRTSVIRTPLTIRRDFIIKCMLC